MSWYLKAQEKEADILEDAMVEVVSEGAISSGDVDLGTPLKDQYGRPVHVTLTLIPPGGELGKFPAVWFRIDDGPNAGWTDRKWLHVLFTRYLLSDGTLQLGMKSGDTKYVTATGAKELAKLIGPFVPYFQKMRPDISDWDSVLALSKADADSWGWKKPS